MKSYMRGLLLTVAAVFALSTMVIEPASAHSNNRSLTVHNTTPYYALVQLAIGYQGVDDSRVTPVGKFCLAPETKESKILQYNATPRPMLRVRAVVMTGKCMGAVYGDIEQTKELARVYNNDVTIFKMSLLDYRMSFEAPK